MHLQRLQIIKTALWRWIGPEKRSKCPAMYSAKRRMLLYREDQGIDLGTPEYLVFQVLSRSNCRLPMLTTLQFAHDPETQANPRAAFFVDFADVRHGARIDPVLVAGVARLPAHDTARFERVADDLDQAKVRAIAPVMRAESSAI